MEEKRMMEFNRHDFVPTPQFSSVWWSERVLELGSVSGLGAPVSSRSVVVRSFIDGELFPDADTYPLVFPSVTDFLLWLRWCALPTEELLCERGHEALMSPARGGEVRLSGWRRALAAMIDESPRGTDATRLLVESLALVKVANKHDRRAPRRDSDFWYVGGHVITQVETIHDYVNTLSDISGWDEEEVIAALNLDKADVQFRDGVWEMSAARWQTLIPNMGHLNVYPID